MRIRWGVYRLVEVRTRGRSEMSEVTHVKEWLGVIWVRKQHSLEATPNWGGQARAQWHLRKYDAVAMALLHGGAVQKVMLSGQGRHRFDPRVTELET